MASIVLVGEMMCEECDAFLGKPHRDSCSKAGRLVENTDATEKFTTVERADKEEPMVGLNRETVELILRSMIPPEVAEDDGENLRKLRTALEQFVASALELEKEAEEESA
jgi:hypothetical protein